MGQRYAAIDADGFVIGFYSDDLHEAIPQGAVALSDDLYGEWVAKANQRRWNGDELVPAERPPPLLPSRPPEPTKAELMAQIQALLSRVQALPA